MINTKTRTIDIGGSTFERDVISKSVQGWTREQVHAALRQTAIGIVGQQAKLGNVASTVTVDNSSFKSVDQAEKKIVVLFGTRLAKAVVTAVQRALIATIEASTDRQSGILADLSNWEWILVPDEGQARRVDPFSIDSMGLKDRLILRPFNVIKTTSKGPVNYATAVNQNVAGGRRGFNFKVGKKASGKKMRANTGKGFFGATAELLRRDPSIRQSFSVYAGFTHRFTAPHEKARAGKGGALQTGQIVLRPQKRGKS
jgi:hypothetical protein